MKQSMLLRKKLAYIIEAHWLFVIIATIFGIIFITITPPLWGTDETSHFARVYQLAHGEIIPQKGKSNVNGKIPSNLKVLSNYAIGDLVDNKPTGGIRGHEVDSVVKYQQLTNQSFSKQQSTYDGATYSPIAYIGPIVGVIISDSFHGTIGNAIFMARIMSLVTYIVLVGFAIKLLVRKKVKWLFFMVALLPICVYQASVVTADNIVIALSLLFTAVLLRLLIIEDTQSIRNKLLAILVVCTVLLPVVKPNYIFLSFALILLPGKLFKARKWAISIKAITVATTVLFMGAWLKLAQAIGSTSVSPRPDGKVVDMHAQMVYTLQHPINFIVSMLHSILIYMDSYIHSATTLIGWNYSTSPILFVILVSCTLVVATLYAREDVLKLRPKLLIISALSFVGIVSIFATLYFAFSPVGDAVVEGVQGRYFLPFLIPIALTLVLYIPIKLEMDDKYAPYIFGVSTTICLIFSALYFLLSLY